MFVIDISNKLKQLRIERAITQKGLSTMLSVALSVVADIETGRRAPSKNTAIKLANYSNTPVDYWLNEIETKNYTESRDAFSSLRDVIKILKVKGYIKGAIPNDKGWELIKEGLLLDLKFMELDEKNQD